MLSLADVGSLVDVELVVEIAVVDKPHALQLRASQLRKESRIAPRVAAHSISIMREVKWSYTSFCTHYSSIHRWGRKGCRQRRTLA